MASSIKVAAMAAVVCLIVALATAESGGATNPNYCNAKCRVECTQIRVFTWEECRMECSRACHGAGNIVDLEFTW